MENKKRCDKCFRQDGQERKVGCGIKQETVTTRIKIITYEDINLCQWCAGIKKHESLLFSINAKKYEHKNFRK